MDDNAIQALLDSTLIEANKDIVLGMLIMANRRFNQRDLEYNVIRGSAYLKASIAVAKVAQDVTLMSRNELTHIEHVGTYIADSIISRIQNTA